MLRPLHAFEQKLSAQKTVVQSDFGLLLKFFYGRFQPYIPPVRPPPTEEPPNQSFHFNFSVWKSQKNSPNIRPRVYFLGLWLKSKVFSYLGRGPTFARKFHEESSLASRKRGSRKRSKKCDFWQCAQKMPNGKQMKNAKNMSSLLGALD